MSTCSVVREEKTHIQAQVYKLNCLRTLLFQAGKKLNCSVLSKVKKWNFAKIL